MLRAALQGAMRRRRRVVVSGDRTARLVSAGATRPDVTFTRASQGWIRSADGLSWPASANDVPRFTTPGGRLIVEGQRQELLLNSALLATQSVTVTAVVHVLSIQGTGSVTLSGAATGTLNGTGAANRVFLAFTPTAGTLTLTVSGSVTFALLEAGPIPSTWIAAAGNPVTRAADQPAWPLPAGMAANGAVLIKARIPYLGAAFQGVLVADDASNSNRLLLRATSAGSFQMVRVGGAGTVTAPTLGSVTAGTTFAAGIAWEPGLARAQLAGTGEQTITGTLPTLNRLLLGHAAADLSQPGFIEIERVDALPYTPSVAELTARLAAM